MQIGYIPAQQDEKDPEVARIDVWWVYSFKTWGVTMYDQYGNTMVTDGEEECSYHHRKADAKTYGKFLADHYNVPLRVFTKQGGI